MRKSDEESRLDRSAAADLWRKTLSQVPTTFGRLAYLCSLRSANTGAYEHHGLAQLFGETESDKTLGQCHAQVFADWLCFSLEQQKADLDDYLGSLDGERREILATWIRLAPYRSFIPVSAREVERKLYLSDLETILELLKHEHAVSYPDPDT